MRAPEKVLFLKFIEQGATVLAYSAIREVIERQGRDNVYFCVFQPNRAILDILNEIPAENILVIRDDSFLLFIRDAWRSIWAIRKRGIDTIIDMEFFARASAIFAYLAGARNRVGLHRFTSEQPYRGDLMTVKVQYNPYIHTARAYRLLVDALYQQQPGEVPWPKMPQADLAVATPRYRPTDALRNQVLQKLESDFGGAVPRSLVLLNPNAGDLLPLRKWETENFLTLGQQLLEDRPDVGLVITGAPSEKPHAEKLLAQFGSQRVISLAGKTSLEELFTLYTMADLLVTNDSGPAHFASMTDIHVVVLFGPETPELFAPLGDRIHVVWKRLACSPCVNAMNHRFSACNNNLCMQLITVDEVKHTVLEHLG
ncbi:MAG: glycosyltransferase family 9 protein [Bacteroidota bacterium]